MAHYHTITMEAYNDLKAGQSASSLKPAGLPRRPGSMFCDPCDDVNVLHEHHHYLNICFSCQKLLAGNIDIFLEFKG
jgi:hypothetical protein